MKSSPKILTANVQHATNKCESSGSRKQLILHRRLQQIFPHMAVLRRHFFNQYAFQCCMLLQGTRGGDFDIFAASGESTAWVLLWKTPVEGLSCSPIRFFQHRMLPACVGQWLYSGRMIQDASSNLFSSTPAPTRSSVALSCSVKLEMTLSDSQSPRDVSRMRAALCPAPACPECHAPSRSHFIRS